MFIPFLVLVVTLSTGVTARALTLDEAVERAVRSHPALDAARHRTAAAEWRTRDADRAPIPSLLASVENISGSVGGGIAETSLSIERTIERGGDRSARAGRARAAQEIARAEAALVERAVAADAVERFLTAWTLQERARVQALAEKLAAQAESVAVTRSRAGAGPPHEVERWRSFRLTTSGLLARTHADLVVARHALAVSLAADSALDDELHVGSPDAIQAVPMNPLIAAAHRSPEQRRSAAMLDAERWSARAAIAERTPDLTVSVGIRHLASERGVGFLASVHLPLPLRGGAAVRASDEEVAAARATATQIAQTTVLDARSAHERYRASLAAWEHVSTDVRASARRGAALMADAFRDGRVSSLESLASQRELLDAELLVIDATADVWRARTTLDLVMRAGRAAE